MRPSLRRADQLRPLTFTRGFTRYAEFGATRVLCTASVEERVPRFLKGRGSGWITAEYGLLPRATGERTARESTHRRQGGRTLEIQRLIGRSMRAAVDLQALGERTITPDCDVIQADGGTRTAAVSGAWIALHDAVHGLLEQEILDKDPLIAQIATVLRRHLPGGAGGQPGLCGRQQRRHGHESDHGRAGTPGGDSGHGGKQALLPRRAGGHAGSPASGTSWRPSARPWPNPRPHPQPHRSPRRRATDRVEP